MNNKGLTLVELITTFTLTAVLLILLLNIVLIIKNIYIKYEIKTELLIKQANLSMYIKEKITNGDLISYTKDGNTYLFTMRDNSTHILTINDNKITFDDYVYELSKDATIGDIESPDVWVSGDIHIKIPILHRLYPEDDYGLNFVYID